MNEIERIDETLNEHLGLIVDDCKEALPELTAIVLYGSHSHGEGSWIQETDGSWRPYNDYDILIVTERIFAHETLSELKKSLAKKIGIHSSNKIKIEACEHLRRYMANIIENKVRLKDMNLITELEDFQKVRVGGNMSHTYKCKSKNDDHIMAAVWAFYILNPDILDVHFDARYEYIGINRYPIAVKNFYSTSDIEVERRRFESRVEETKKILQISDFNSFTLPEESLESKTDFNANCITPREQLEQRMEEIRNANEDGTSQKIFGFF